MYDPTQVDPIQWPPSRFFFAGHKFNRTPRHAWGLDEWRDYAQCLEKYGASLFVYLQSELEKSKRKRSRKKNSLPENCSIENGVFYAGCKPTAKKGRKANPARKSLMIARETFALATANNIRQHEAFKLVCNQRGYGNRTPSGIKFSNVRRLISEIKSGAK